MGLYPNTHGIDTASGIGKPHPFENTSSSLAENKRQPEFYWMSEKEEDPAAEGDKDGEKPLAPEKVHVLQPPYYQYNNPITNPDGLRTTFYPKTTATKKE